VPGVAAPPAPGQPTAAAAGSNGGPVTPTPRPGQPLRVGPAAPATGAPAPPSRDGGRSGGRPIAAIIGAVAGVVVVAVVAGVLFLGGGDDNGAKPAPNTIGSNAASQGDGGTSTTPKGTSSTPLKPNAFTTAVLNGTTTPGLARGVATRLQNAKFRIGNVTNAADQSHSATIIEFAPGHRKEALAVADAIDVGSDAVQALTPGSRAIAGEEAFVVVTVGADQNVSPQQQP
jgi:hypothetical protein